MSRSGKKILHVDDNDYYGESEAAFSLQEAEEFAKQVHGGEFVMVIGKTHSNSNTDDDAFRHVSILKPDQAASDPDAPALSFSRAYSLALCPQIVYARSKLLHTLVSSRVHKQLEFLAVGSWWVYSSAAAHGEDTEEGGTRSSRLFKVPSSREDIFSDRILDFKAKRSLTKFLRFIVEYEEQPEIWEEHKDKPFATFLADQFKVPATLHPPLLALSLSLNSPSATTTGFALQRIGRHLRSIGVFGAGFGAVIPKYGGMSEVTQVACRACAVGGGVYVLSKGVTGVESAGRSQSAETADMEQGAGIKVHLKGGEFVTASWVISQGNHGQSPGSGNADAAPTLCKSITIVSSPLTPLFPPIAEEAPPPACAVVTFPSGSVSLAGQEHELPPVNIFVHSADTGECAAGQSKLQISYLYFFS